MTVTQVDTAIDVITGLDFSPVLPCEHRRHESRHLPDDPARWEVRWACKACRSSGHYLLCESGRLRLYAAPVVQCQACGATSTWDNFCTSCHPISEVK